ncbi:MAG: hypothetical protein R3Y26_11555 [Rikenellaceae bacterium]
MELIEVIGIVIGAVATILAGVWFIIIKAIKIGEVKSQVNQIEIVAKANTEDIATAKTAISRIDRLEKGYDVHSDEITSIKRWVIKKDRAMVNELIQKQSPMKITELGRKLLVISGADKILPQISDLLIEEMEKKTIKTAYDVEVEAYFVVLNNESNDAFIALKNFIYNESEYVSIENDGAVKEVKLDFDNILRLISVDLRDIYLEKHPELLE